MEVMFNQTYETSFAQLLLCLACIQQGMVTDVHLDWIFEFESKLLDYFENPQALAKENNNGNVNTNKIKCIERVWKELNELGQYEQASVELKEDLKQALSYFGKDNLKLFRPKPIVPK